jgi:FkbM family methyltransferase
MEVRLRNGIQFSVTNSTRIEFKVAFWRNDYTWPLPLISSSHAGTIIDLGANVGYFTLFAATAFPGCRIISVEPFPKNLVALNAVVSSNALKKCSVLGVAVSDKTGTVTFGTANAVAHPTDARIVHSEDVDGENFFSCPSVSLDQLVADHVSGEITLLKMDIEGAEYRALYNASDATFERIQRIALETEDLDSENQNTDALAEFLRMKGFSIVEVTPRMLHGWRRNLTYRS